MADNKQAGLAVGAGPTFATDEIAGVDYPRTKIVWGVDGTATDASASNPLPVVQTGTPALPTGAATEATLSAASAKLPATLGQKAMAASMAVALASDQSAIPITDNSGSITTDTPQLPSTLGQKAMASALAVSIASDQSAIPVSGTVTITPSGTQTVAGAKTNNNAAPGATNIGALPAVANAAAPTQTEGNLVALRATLSGDLAITLDGETPVLGAGSAIIGKVGIDQTTPGTTNGVQVNAALPAGTNEIGGVNVTKFAGTAADTNSGNKSAGTLRVVMATDQPNLTTALNVSLASVPSHAVTNAGTFAVQDSEKVVDNAAFTDGTTKVLPAGFIFDEAAGTALTENDAGAARMDSKRAIVIAVEDATTRGQRQAVNAGGAAEVHGDAAHGASVAGNPVLQGMEARTTDGTAVTSGQVVRPIATALGKQVIMPYALPGSTWKYVGAAGGIVTTTAITIKTAGGAGVINYITSILLVNSHQTIGTEVVINDGAAGTAIFRTWCQFAGGGCALNFVPPLASSANTLLEIKEVTATGTAGIVAEVIGYSGIE